MNNQMKGFLLVFLSAAGFGSMPVLARVAYQDGANMYELLTARFVVAWAVLAVYLWIKKPRRILTKKERGGAILMGLCGYSVASLCFFSALQRISAPLASIFLYTYPTFVTGLSALIGMEKMDRVKAGALLISFLGIFLILGSSFSSIDIGGVALAIAAAILYSAYVLLGNWTLRDAPLTAATMWISLAAASGIGGYGFLSGQLSFQFGMNAWLAIAGLAIFSTVAAIVAFLRGIVLVGASRASIISTFEPLITVVLAAVFLSEVLGVVQLLGGFLILASAILVNRTKKEDVKKVATNISI
ncbi:MAG: DMT family transporter [Clostridiales bacterium]|nr:DMT family transporter [Clostridiales bacterium]